MMTLSTNPTMPATGDLAGAGSEGAMAELARRMVQEHERFLSDALATGSVRRWIRRVTPEPRQGSSVMSRP